ncbi:MAG TPA: hypothetical protein VHA52_12585, partial [Candidatus Babeliaceae bacterium]|nr:hypothetical protein [Candidatus Babeliaceae bacterium]
MTSEAKLKGLKSDTAIAPHLEDISVLILEGQKLFKNSLSEADQLRARFRIAVAATVARTTSVPSNNEALYRSKITNASLFATEAEIETLTELVSVKPDHYSEQEIRKIQQYRDDLIRSQPLNFAIAALRT